MVLQYVGQLTITLFVRLICKSQILIFFFLNPPFKCCCGRPQIQKYMDFDICLHFSNFLGKFFNIATLCLFQWFHSLSEQM